MFFLVFGRGVGRESEAYLEPNQVFTMELFCKNSWELLAVNYFCKKALSKMFDWVLKTSLSILHNKASYLCFCCFNFLTKDEGILYFKDTIARPFVHISVLDPAGIYLLKVNNRFTRTSSALFAGWGLHVFISDERDLVRTTSNAYDGALLQDS